MLNTLNKPFGGPKNGEHLSPEIFNTDQGSQFTSQSLHELVDQREHSHQHGRSGQSARQRFRRAAVANGQVRGGLSEGLRGSSGCCRKPRTLLYVLQWAAVSSGVELPNAGGRISKANLRPKRVASARWAVKRSSGSKRSWGCVSRRAVDVSILRTSWRLRRGHARRTTRKRNVGTRLRIAFWTRAHELQILEEEDRIFK